MLFPADAQVGNWLSWENVRFGEGKDTVTATDLLSRVVFYKVGHHGSHNATLKEKGLEKMSSLGLAFIPVDHEMALKKHWGQMPLETLVEALVAKTGGAVVRVDKPLPAGTTSVSQDPDHEPSLWYEWSMAF